MQPARAEDIRSTTYRITVSYSGSELRFQDPTPIVLAEGDLLILHFEGIPVDMIPGVTFSGNGDGFASPLGPFQEALQTAGVIVLRGNSGSTGTFQCRAWLSPKVRGEERLLSADELRVDNGLSARPAKEIRVLVRPKPAPDEVLLPAEVPVEVTVDLEEVAHFAPDCVVWNFVFENLEPRDYEPLLYLDAEATPVRTGPFGPFESLSAAGIFEPLGEGRILAYRLITAGNNDVPGQYHFSVGVLPVRAGTSNGIFSVVDPIIDNIGPPHV
ncbi:MAG: hypothetical protein ACJ759_18275 [Thermoanaerobaculia bacterium]